MPGSEMTVGVPPTVLISGAAGTLGNALATAFVASGWRVAAGQHHAPANLLPEGVFRLFMDVTRSTSIDDGVGQVIERWGRLDAFVHCAGLTVDALLLHHRVEDWDAVVRTNLSGAFLCARAVFEPMRRQRNGQVVLLGSFAGRIGAAGQTSYATAKAGLAGLTQDLARIGGPDNIRVNLVLPGVVESSLTENVSPKVRAGWLTANQLGRLNDTGEISRFVVFLCGLENVSGQVFQLDSRLAPLD